MIIYFVTTEETKPKHKYCVQYRENDGVLKQTHFGSKQKKLLLDYLSRKFDDNDIVELNIKKYD